MLRLVVSGLVCLLAAGCGPRSDEDDSPEELPDPKAESAPPPAQPTAGDSKQPPPAVELPGATPGEHQGNHGWSARLGGTGSDAARSIAIDGEGNLLVTGYFSDTVDFGGGELTAHGDKDVFVAKYDADGKHLWSKQLGGKTEDIGQKVVADAEGNVIVTGSFTGSGEFGSGKPFKSAGKTDVFVARYSPAGDHLWSRRFGGDLEDRGYSIAIDSDDNVIVTGYFTTAMNLGGDDLVSAGQADIFVVKYAPTSEHIWSWRIGGKVDDLGRAVAVDGTDAVVLAGDFHEDIVLGGGKLASTGNADVLLAKFTADGKHLWSKSFGAHFHDFAVGLDVSAEGHIAVTGGFEGSIDFGGGELEGDRKKEMFVARFDGDGRHLWSKGFGGRDDDVGSGVRFDSHGNVYLSGWFWRDVDFGGGKLESAGQNDVVLAKFAPDGTHLWSKQFGDAGGDYGRAIAVDAGDRVVLVGTFRGTVSFGGEPLEFAGTDEKPTGDAFVARFSP